MNKIIAGITTALVFTIGASITSAAPFNAASNPNIVANYPTGPHGIVVVMRAGQSGNFQQWFEGTSASEGYHGEHSLWKESQTGECKDKEYLVSNAHPEWGDYLAPDTDYCVKTNDYLQGAN